MDLFTVSSILIVVYVVMFSAYLSRKTTKNSSMPMWPATRVNNSEFISPIVYVQFSGVPNWTIMFEYYPDVESYIAEVVGQVGSLKYFGGTQEFKSLALTKEDYRFCTTSQQMEGVKLTAFTKKGKVTIQLNLPVL